MSKPEQGYAKLTRVTRHALLIGSETYGLGGCNADVELMRQVLAARAFDAIDVRTGADASRAGIIAGLDALVASIAADDAVVLYYSGHGGRVARPDFADRKEAGLSVYFQFIVPFDMSESEPGDFRGLLSEELTQYQRRMTEAFRNLDREPNVVTILDCCHSGYMARDLEAKQKSVEFEPKMFRMRGIREHLEQLGAQAGIGGLTTNRDVVRLVACQPEQSAYEMPSQRGGRHGALTDALASVLEELGPTPVPWGVIGDLVRRRVRAVMPEQRPDVEGPTERLMFSADSVPARTAMPVSWIDGVFSIEAAAVVGIAVDDQFQLLAPGGTEIGTAVVSDITGGNAILKISPGAQWNAATDVVAVPTRISVPKALVQLDVADGGADALHKLVDGSNHLAVTTDGTGILARIQRAQSGRLVVLDQLGAPWRSTEFTDDVQGHQQLVQDLDAIAIGQRLADLPSGQGPSALEANVVIEFGQVDGKSNPPLPPHGASLTVGSHVSLSVRNTGTEPLFAWVFRVDVSGRSSLVTNAASSGTTLDPVGGEGDKLSVFEPAGERLSWPNDVPTTPVSAGGNGARGDTFVILLADRRSDLSSLASPRRSTRGGDTSPLDAILDEVRTGTRTRGDAPTQDGAPPLRYRLERVEFLLVPDQADAAVSPREVPTSVSQPDAAHAPGIDSGQPDSIVKFSVSHGSFEQADYALMVPTYEDDTFTGAERILDMQLHGLLTANFDAGAYPGPLDGRSLFIAPRPDEDIESEPPGAYVVGLGQTADLTRDRVCYAVRQALLDRCKQLYDQKCTPTERGVVEVGLSSTLLGVRNDDGLRIADSVAGIVEGVLEANKALAIYEESRLRAGHPVTAPVRLAALELIDRLSDRADLAAVAIRGIEYSVRLPAGYSDEHHSVTVHKKPGSLPAGAALADDARHEWRRFSITSTRDSATTSGVISFDISDVSGGARADRTVHSIDPVVLDSLAQRLSAQRSDADTVGALYDMLIPDEMRASFESLSSMQLIVDETSANYPWELLSAPPQHGRASSAAHMSVIRQFSEIGLRRLAPVRAARGTVLIIAAGSAVPTAKLPGPHKEAVAISKPLVARFRDAVEVLDDEAKPLDSGDLMVALHRGHQILHLAGHGEFRADDVASTGAVLNADLRLRADTVQHFRRVPELVFINCCSLAQIGSNPLAAGLARAFMSIGARAVIAAGWRIDDTAAEKFAVTFYEQFLSGESFGHSVAASRRACLDAGGEETWAAYQCYGDPTYVLGGGLALQPPTMTTAVGFDDLIRRLETLQTRAADLGRPGGGRMSSRQAQLSESYQLLASWAGANGYEQFSGSVEQIQRTVNAQRLLARVAAYIGDFRSAAERYLALVGVSSTATDVSTRTRSRWDSVEDLQQGSNLLSRAALTEWRGCADPKTRNVLRGQMKLAVALAREARRLVPENESYSMLGGALKRLAVASTGAQRRQLIARAAAAYQGLDVSAAAAVPVAQAEAYRRHNAYQLAVLVGADDFVRPPTNPTHPAVGLLVDQSRKHNAEYWDNSAPGDAALTDLLTAQTSEMANARQRMVGSYLDAFERRSTWRERSSTIDHLRDLHDLLPDSDERKSHLVQALQALVKWEKDDVA